MSRLLNVGIVQESAEEWSKAYLNVCRASTAGTDAVIHYKQSRVGGNRRQAGFAVQEFAYVCG